MDNRFKIKVIKALIVAVYLVFYSVPLLYLIANSFKPMEDFSNPALFFPTRPTLDAYRDIFYGTAERPAWILTFRNSLVIATLSALISIVVALPAAYAFARARFMASNHLFFWLLSTRFAPGACFIIPYVLFFKSLNMLDSVVAIALAHTSFNVPFSVLLLTSFVAMIPESVDKSAQLDGCSWSLFFRKILLPNLKIGLITTFFFAWAFSWSEMALGLALSTTYNSTPFTVYVTRFLEEIGSAAEWAQAAAAGVISIIPGTVLIALYGKYILKGFTLGRL